MLSLLHPFEKIFSSSPIPDTEIDPLQFGELLRRIREWG